jgi:hypothetical protein
MNTLKTLQYKIGKAVFDYMWFNPVGVFLPGFLGLALGAHETVSHYMAVWYTIDPDLKFSFDVTMPNKFISPLTV